MRVEGKTKTIFEDFVTSDGHPLTKDSSGQHPCDGTNGGVNKTPGATMFAALDDATKLAGLQWGATWDDGFQDFFLNSIGPDASTKTDFWGYALNGIPTSVGACQQQVSEGDEVLFYYGGTFKYILHAVSARKVRAGKRFHVRVVAYETTYNTAGEASTTKRPIKGARIGGRTTDAAGLVTLRYRKPGTRRLKGTRAESVRSNQIAVKVFARR